MSDAPKCEHDLATIVLIGNFNPSIFQPSWLAANKLIRDEEAQSATIDVISHVVSSFRSGWLGIQVTDNRFAASSTSPAHHEPLRDLVVAIFSLLEHTPAHVMGLNRTLHFRVPTLERWHEIGHALVPKDSWQPFLSNPLTRTVSVEGHREGGDSNKVTVKVEPSSLLPSALVVDCNDHFQPEEASTRMLMEMLMANWKDSLAFGMRAADTLLRTPSK